MMPIIGKRSFFSLLRWKNLLLIFLTQWLFCYSILDINVFISLPIILTIFATILVASSGNIINDYFDIETDKINKPDKQIITQTISRKKSIQLYFFLNIISISIAAYLSYRYENLLFVIIFILAIILLYFYSYTFKKEIIIGNLIISLLSALPILYVWIVYLEIESNYFYINSTEKLVYFYMIFAFLVTLVREIVKDIEDIKGDQISNCKTLPVIMGIKISKLVSLIVLLCVNFLLLLSILYLTKTLAQIYFILLIFLPLLTVTYLLTNAKIKKDFHSISQYLKLIMMTGIFSMIII